MDSNHVEAQVIFWIIGIKPTASVRITNDVVLVPKNEMPISPQTAEILTKRTLSGVQYYSHPEAALVCSIRQDKFHNNDDMVSEAEKFRPKFDLLNEICDLLNLVDGIKVCGLNGYVETPHSVPNGPFDLPMFWGPRSRQAYSRGSTECAGEDLADVGNLFTWFQNSPDKERISHALHRYSQAKGQSRSDDSALDLGISLEMLLLESSDKTQMRLRFGLRGSWLIGGSYSERAELYGFFKDIYDYRSSVAHNGKLGSKQDPSRVPDFVQLGGEVFRKVISQGIPSEEEWERIVLGGACSPGEASVD